MAVEDEPDMAGAAAALSLSIDEETRDACREIARDLEDRSGPLLQSPEETEDVGQRSTDDYNALLAIHDEPRVEGEGPLSGLTFAVKDNIAAKGLHMTCGTTAFSLVPSFDAVVVERLLEAGAAFAGKANMEPFALGATGEASDFGAVRNPLNENRVSGGSSSGSGAAVAAGLVDFALGTDTGGSVRLPAACCGLIGAKPTHGLVPRAGFVDMAPSLDTIGPLARDVETASIVLDTIAGFDPRDPSSSQVEVGSLSVPDGSRLALTVGVPRSMHDPADQSVREVLEQSADRLDETADLEVLDVSLDLGEIVNAFFHLGVVEFSWLLQQTGIVRGQGTGYNEELRTAFEQMADAKPEHEHVARRLLPSAALDARDAGRYYTAARNEMLDFRSRLDALFDEVDALLTPTIRVPPPGFDAFESKAEGLRKLAGNTMPFNLAGNPAVTLPAGEVDGLPIGAQLVTPRFEDRRALQLAARLESLRDDD